VCEQLTGLVTYMWFVGIHCSKKFCAVKTRLLVFEMHEYKFSGRTCLFATCMNVSLQ